MNDFMIVTDTASDLPADYIEKTRLSCCLLVILWMEEYITGIRPWMSMNFMMPCAMEACRQPRR